MTKRIIALLVSVLFTVNFSYAECISAGIPGDLTDMTKNVSASVTVEQAVVIIMTKLGKNPSKGVKETDLGQKISGYAKDHVNYAYSKGWLSAPLPRMSSIASKRFVEGFFLSCSGYKVFESGITSEQQAGVDSVLLSLAAKTKIIKGNNPASLNSGSNKSDISKLLDAYRKKQIGWHFRSMGWKLGSAKKLEAAALVFKICADAGLAAGTTAADYSDACYGYGSIMSHNVIGNYFAASEYLKEAIKISPNSSTGKNASILLKKLPPIQLGFDFEPERPVTYEQLISMYANWLYFRTDTTPKTFQARDKKGNLPSEWAKKYVNYIYYKGLAPSVPDSFGSPAPRYWAASFAARVKFLANYEYDRYYPFDDIDGIGVDDKMYMNIAVDRNLFPMPQTVKFNPDGNVLRKELHDFINRSKKPGQPHKAVYYKRDGKKIVDAYYQDLGVAHFTYQNEVIDQRHALIDIANFATVYYYLDDPHKSVFSSPSYKDEGTKVIRTRFGLNKPIMDGIEKCRQYGMKPMLEFDGSGDRAYNLIKNASDREDIINDLVHLTDLYGLSGVHVCFEHMPSNAREAYSLFIEGLSSRLKPMGKLLTVVVGAYSSDQLEAKSPYDLARLGKACDYIKVILYDDFPVSRYSVTGKDGPVSRVAWNERILKYMVLKVPPQKILLGIGAYGEDFDLTTKKDAKNISLTAIDSIISNAVDGSVKHLFNSEYQVPYIEYKDSAGHDHRLWYENEKSFTQKMEQVNKYGLGGIFYCWLGSNSQDFYNAVSKVLR